MLQALPKPRLLRTTPQVIPNAKKKASSVISAFTKEDALSPSCRAASFDLACVCERSQHQSTEGRAYVSVLKFSFSLGKGDLAFWPSVSETQEMQQNSKWLIRQLASLQLGPRVAASVQV